MEYIKKDKNPFDMSLYLDYNATTPVHPEVAAAMAPYHTGIFGNPSSTHQYGARARQAVEHARMQVAAFLGCEVDEILFTSGGSESNNLAIKGVAAAYRVRGSHIITSAIEHPAVLDVCAHLEHAGNRVTRVQVDEYGMVSVENVLRACCPDTILVTIMHANNEVGTIQPIAEIAKELRARGILFHTDAAQSAGKIPVRVEELGVDLLSLAGHKMYAPKGVGALYVRRGIRLEKQMHGAAHEQNLRAGTENVAYIVGFGLACEIAAKRFEELSKHTRAMRDAFENGLKDFPVDIRVHGHPEQRLPNTTSVAFAGIEAETLLSELSDIAVSPGAACHAESVSISHVLEAMQIPVDYARGTVRFSTGSGTTRAEIEQALAMIRSALQRLRTTKRADEDAPTSIAAVRLTQYTHGLGCACKLRRQVLDHILAGLPRIDHPDALVGVDTCDDAAVYRISPDTAIVHSVDFFTPIVDDPYEFGAIAAANALSDIYAMGAEALFALNIVGFPTERLPQEVLLAILRGAGDKAREAGIPILGGHTIDDVEPKFGMAVVGRVHPDRLLTNCNAQINDDLVLTKPIGTGILSTAMKRAMTSEDTNARVVSVMSELNKTAAEVMQRHPVNACTDITGFGLMGHLLEMTRGSAVNAEISASAVPLLPDVLAFIAAGVVPGGTLSNLEYCSEWVDWSDEIASVTRTALADAQTSGGLLIALPATASASLLDDLLHAGVRDAVIIGCCREPGDGRVSVLP